MCQICYLICESVISMLLLDLHLKIIGGLLQNYQIRFTMPFFITVFVPLLLQHTATNFMFYVCDLQPGLMMNFRRSLQRVAA